MYKIVETREENGVNLCFVPEGWEIDGFLFWPPGKYGYQSLRKNGNSLPNTQTWSKQPCKVKRDGIPSFLEAVSIEDHLSKFSDTEDEEAYIRKKAIERKHPIQSTLKDNVDDFNSNNMLIQASHEPETKKKTTASHSGSCEKAHHTAVQAKTSPLPHFLEKTVKPSNTTNINDIVTLEVGHEGFLTLPMESNNNNNIPNDVYTRFDAIDAKQQKLMDEVCGLLIKFDKLIDILMKQKSPSEKPVLDPGIEDSLESLLPVTSAEKMELLNKKLRDKDFQASVVRHMSTIEGTDGNKNGTKIGYLLIDKFFDRTFLVECSWTGSSKNKEVKKVPFLKFEAISETFFKIIHLADSRYSYSDNSDFLRKILKNSLSRSKQIKIGDQNRTENGESEKIVQLDEAQ